MRPRILRYEAVGEGDPLVLVPGGLTGWVSWIPHQDRLSPRYRVIRVQPIHNELGSAGEPGEPGYTREVERESLRLTLDELGVEQADFAGWSNGGRAVIEFTLTYPQRVRSLTLVEPGASWILEELGETDEDLERFNRYMYWLTGREVTEDDLAVFLSIGGFIDDLAAAREHPFWERSLPHRMSLSWVSQELMRSDYSVADLASITCPVLLTKGTVTKEWLKRVVDILAERLPNARVVELEGGHAHHLESIDRFLGELEAHLSQSRLG